ncbi:MULTISPECIES: nitrate reductase associated protein [Fischerella]|uniref:Nitrate reductase associated protein n=1 Tax=Fischerella muscicola CCMEE 5323 TaxID=2019572 RepID=A0A2N6JY64_FISMU|nr:MULTISPECIES: nitrate reductase associated protein [Fischerella]MBD2434203.1 nitrate reductase associated protein [Fischerella sp. FACHB-380]PLZ85710.1 nitrate reductase associated protein [Fischerella muscicola CCMEE 5323]
MATEFFQFEADFVDSLRCIPMQVRCKLDTCGIKLKLSDWNHMTQVERQQLVELPCTTESEIQAYRKYIQDLILQRTGTPVAELTVEFHPAWMDTTTVPASVYEKAQEMGVTLTTEHWSNLNDLQRFALIKLSRSHHENKNFLPALKEFNLL